MSKIALEALGCKLNQAEMDALAHQLVHKGYQLTESVGEADTYVLNTCTVTHIADRKSRQLLRTVRRQNPQVRVFATGCYAHRAPEELERLGIADAILNNTQKGHLADLVERVQGPATGGITGSHNRWQNRTRSLIKIQEGCNQFCTFCIVPHVRGMERSVPLDRILPDVRARLAAGYQEIVLTGSNIGRYAWNGRGFHGLTELVRRILNQTDVVRLRLSSLQPQDLTHELIRLWSDERLCPHLHIPLQSGSETILRRMHRGYSLRDYERALHSIREAIPGLAVTTDVLVGFPGEGEREFEESYGFCERMHFANMHVFPYSARHGTAAFKMPKQAEEGVKKERSQMMLALSQHGARGFRRQFLGQTMKVLWENGADGTTWNGLTANYIRVRTKSSQYLSGQLLAVKLVAEKGPALLGENLEGGYSQNG